MARKVRRAQTQADALAAAGDAEGAKALRAKARQMTAELKQWCRTTGRDFYPERVQLLKVGDVRNAEALYCKAGNHGVFTVLPERMSKKAYP